MKKKNIREIITLIYVIISACLFIYFYLNGNGGEIFLIAGQLFVGIGISMMLNENFDLLTKIFISIPSITFGLIFLISDEFIHLFEDIDNAKPPRLSINLLKILQNPREFKTFKVNLLNRLDKLSNKYFVQESIEDNIENKKKFLNELFSNAEVNENFDDFLKTIREYDNSKLLESNMYFFWYMVQSKPQEFNQWKSEIYQHFNC